MASKIVGGVTKNFWAKLVFIFVPATVGVRGDEPID
jgi:putative effector of murein hydrolase LrgA (UPF0299 family)